MSKREKIIYLIFGAVYLFLFIGIIPAHYKICEINQYTENENCTAYQLLPFLFIKVQKILDAVGVAITALATIAIATFTYYLKKSTDRLWDAGERQLRHLENTSRRQLRAYVHVQRVDIPGSRLPTTMGAIGPIPGQYHTFRLVVTLENSGQTPTRHTLIAMNYRCSVDKLPPDFQFPDPGPDKIEFAIIGPRAIFMTPVIDIPATEVAMAVAGMRHLYGWGWVDYNDVFEGSKRHRTEFCFEIVPDKGPPSQDTTLRFVNHAQFNGADEDCQRQPAPYTPPA